MSVSMNYKQYNPNGIVIDQMVVQKATPWMVNSRSIYSPRLRLHQETIEFFNYITPSDKEHEDRKQAFQDLQTILLTSLNQRDDDNNRIEVIEFGSFATRLYLPDGDIDVVIIDQQQSSHKLMLKVAKILQNYQDRYIKVELIKGAKVPIIKMKDSLYNYDFDIAFNQIDGLNQLKEVNKLLKQYPESKYIMMVMKVVLKQRKLNETYCGGIGSFLLFCMVLAYIRHKRQEMINNSTINSYNEIMLGDYLIGFMKFYGVEFNEKENQIIMTDGGSIQKKPKGYDFGFSLISPQDDQHDIGNAAFKIKDIQNFFKNRYQLIVNYNYDAYESILKYVVNPQNQDFNFFNSKFRNI